MAKKQIENTFRLIEHNNNIIIISVVPENLKKFICGKIKAYIFKTCSHEDFINGSGAKNIMLSYKGIENGSKILNLDKNKAILWNGNHFYNLNIPYLEKFDTKANNEPILLKYKEDVLEKVNEKVNEMVKEKVNENFLDTDYIK
jgi:hypothetical protein